MQGATKLSSITFTMRLQPTHAAWFFAALAFACAKSSRDASPALQAAADAGLRAGDLVVIESTSATFVEGKVNSIVRDRAQLTLVPSGESADQLIADIY